MICVPRPNDSNLPELFQINYSFIVVVGINESSKTTINIWSAPLEALAVNSKRKAIEKHVCTR